MNDLYGDAVDGSIAERAAWIEKLNFGGVIPLHFHVRLEG